MRAGKSNRYVTPIDRYVTQMYQDESGCKKSAVKGAALSR